MRSADSGAALILPGRSVDKPDDVATELRATGHTAVVVPTDVTRLDALIAL